VSRFGLGAELEARILEAGELGFLLWRKGWCEGAAGNLSVAIELPYSEPSGALRRLAHPVPTLAGRSFLVSASGARFRDIAKQPERCLGVVRVVEGGVAYSVDWGFLGGGRPSSELPAHFAVHARRAEIGQPIGAILHAHATHLIALSFVPRFRRDPELLTGILYRMHTEAYQGLPRGVATVGFRVPGGQELAVDAAAALTRSDVALWSHHGVISVGEGLDDAADLMEYGDKAAQLFLMISQRNDAGAYLSEQDLRELKEAYHASR
jgi:rhamnulose-1-phosphate aldolase